MNSVYCTVGVSSSTELTPTAFRLHGCCLVASFEIGEPRDAVLWGDPEAMRRLATYMLRAADDADLLPELPDAEVPDCEAFG